MNFRSDEDVRAVDDVRTERLPRFFLEQGIEVVGMVAKALRDGGIVKRLGKGSVDVLLDLLAQDIPSVGGRRGALLRLARDRRQECLAQPREHRLNAAALLAALLAHAEQELLAKEGAVEREGLLKRGDRGAGIDLFFEKFIRLKGHARRRADMRGNKIKIDDYML